MRRQAKEKKIMIATDAYFQGDIPEIYEQFLVPILFEGYASDLAARVADCHPERVLEVAAGSGVLTRAMAARLAPEVQIVATDLNQAMLDIAAKKGVGRQVEWKQADALELPFESTSFDVVACQFGVMFFLDKQRGYSQILRVLKPKGTFVFNTWASLAENEIARTVSEAIVAAFPDDPTRFLERTPHGYCERETIETDLRHAGFRKVTIDTIDMAAHAPSPRDVAIAFCRGTPLKMEIAARAADDEKAVQAVAAAFEQRFGSGRIHGNLRAHVVVAEVR
jgi:ubiquinone/menaquinone biosynthesis C-methylase UbiE